MARDLWVKIRADVSGLQAGLAKAQAGVSAFGAEVQRSAQKRAAITQLGGAFGKVGLAAAAGLGLSVKAAIDWESAWAGVTKTVDGTTSQMAKLEGQLRNMAKELPASHQEIAAVAEAAGQLGVAREDVAAFTRVMVDLGETTNLSADEAATSIAQMMNIMQTAPEDVDNLGAALVELGNNGASTERDIVQMAHRLAGAGKTVGLTEAEVLALANALASVGIEADAGGSSVSKIFIDMAKAVKTGSPDLKKWAEASGQTVKQFKDLFASSPAEAFDAFTKGLGKINKEGGDVFSLLDDLGQSDVRVTRALLAMANSGDLLSDSLKTGSAAWKDNSALADEAAKRYATSASKIKVAWNGIKDNMIEIGAVALPIVADFAEAIAGLTDAFADLPKPLQGAITKTLALTAVIGLGAFAVSRAITSFASMKVAMEALGIASGGAATKMLLMRGALGIGGIALASMSGPAHKSSDALGVLADTAAGATLGFAVGGPWGAAIGAGAGALYGLYTNSKKSAGGMDKSRESAKKLAASLDQVTGKATEATRALVFEDLRKSGAAGNASAIGIATRDLVSAALGQADAIKRVKKAINEALTSGDPIAIGVAGPLLAQLADINGAFKEAAGGDLGRARML